MGADGGDRMKEISPPFVDTNEDNFRPETQQRAASHPASSIWVNASAGAGKTTVLTDRVLRLLLEGVQPQRILCLTFTRAAAAEMAMRVMSKLSHWATCNENDLSQSLVHLQGQASRPGQLTIARRLFAQVLACPGGMRIRTIHAFCQELLRRFPIEAGLPPHFNVIEEDDARAIQLEAQMALLRQAETNRELKYLVCELGEKGFVKAMRSVLAERVHLEKAATEAGSPEKLIAKIAPLLDVGSRETAESIRHKAVDVAGSLEADIRQAALWLVEGSKKYTLRGTGILAWLGLPPMKRVAAFDDYCRYYLTQAGAPYADLGNKDLLIKYPQLEDILKRETRRLQHIRERLDVLQIVETTIAVLTFGFDLIRNYQTRKKERAVLDYDDLIVRAEELLHRPSIAPWVLYKLDGGLDHILVDEAQDTSHAQWGIVRALADDFFSGAGARSDDQRTLFVVGDEKQSIFSFQNADPESFMAMRHYFARRITGAEKKYSEILLQISFRSAPAILRAVDEVFSHDRARTGVSVDAIIHQAFDQKKAGHVEVWPLLAAPRKDDVEPAEWELPLDYEKDHDSQAELAGSIASKIKGWLAAGDILLGHDRPIVAGDIMILLRRRGRFADLMVRALKEQNVPVTGVDRMRLVEQLSVMDLLALMQFVLLPEDDLNLATVLRGPLLNLSEDHLMTLSVGRKSTLWQSVSGDPETTAAHAYLLRWLNAADYMTPFAMIAHILDEPCPGSVVSGRCAIWSRLGSDALDPIDELLNAAQNFSQLHAPSLQAFLHWLMSTEAEIKREMGGGAGQVRIMTVHAAKGLEAPIVFLPDTASVPRVQDMPNVLWSPDNIPLYSARRPSSGIAKSLWEEARRKQMEEYRRLLYVALTRAGNRLYIAGWESPRKELTQDVSWYSLIFESLKTFHEPSAVHKADPQPVIAFADPAPTSKKKVTHTLKITSPKTTIPAWARTQVSQELPLSKPVLPSQLLQDPAAVTPDKYFARGRIIHRLLQSLPDVELDKRDPVASKFLGNPQYGLSVEQQNEIKTNVINLLNHPDHAPLFMSSSRSEVSLAGQLGGQEIVGQIDRLSVTDEEVWIVDYKTNRLPPETLSNVPQNYIGQLSAYSGLLKKIYPTKPIRCFLLWTYGPKLMEIPRDMLALDILHRST
jgi:ATP-dependent helicase/nuclease subunit A